MLYLYGKTSQQTLQNNKFGKELSIMIQDIAPHTYHNEYKPVAPDKESHILAYEEGKILMKKMAKL